MPTPIATLITQDIRDVLAQVQTAQGYSVDLVVEHLNEENHEFNRPRHLLAIVDPGDPVKLEDPSQGKDEYTRDYLIHVWVMPSQTDGRPIFETIDAVVADVVTALCREPASYRRAGLAIDTRAGDPETIGPVANSLAYMVNIPITVRYETTFRDGYSQT